MLLRLLLPFFFTLLSLAPSLDIDPWEAKHCFHPSLIIGGFNLLIFSIAAFSVSFFATFFPGLSFIKSLSLIKGFCRKLFFRIFISIKVWWLVKTRELVFLLDSTVFCGQETRKQRQTGSKCRVESEKLVFEIADSTIGFYLPIYFVMNHMNGFSRV